MGYCSMKATMLSCLIVLLERTREIDVLTLQAGASAKDLSNEID